MTKKPIAYDAYETLAEPYAARIDTKPHNAYYDRPALLSLLPEVRGRQVLDAGCGPGAYTRWLVEQGAQVVAVDASPKMIALARQRVGSGATFHQLDLDQPLTLFHAESFDLVLSALTISYIEDLQRLFAEFARILRPGGSFVFSTHHPHTDFQRHGGSYFETALVSDAWRGFGSETMPVPFYRRPLSAITNALSDSGFVIERLIEPQPTAEFRQADPEAYQQLMVQPGFIAFRARRDKI